MKQWTKNFFKVVISCLIILVGIIVIPKQVKAEETYGDLTYVENDDGTIMITGCIGSPTSVVIPKSINGKSVTQISWSAFNSHSLLESISIPSSVTSIADYTFCYCTSLESISIPSSVTSIGSKAFEYTPWLEAQKNKNPLVVVNNILVDASMCSGTVTIPDGVKEIQDGIFYDNSKITSLIIPASVTKIDGIYGCSNLTNISVVDTNKTYSSYDGCLYNKTKSEIILCPKMKDSVTINNNVTSIKSGAFNGCKKINNISLPNKVKTIESNAFNDCSNLTKVTFQEGLTFIGMGAFCGCSKLNNVTLPNSVTEIDSNIFTDCTSLTSFTIPKNVKYVTWEFFRGCTNLKKVTLHEGIVRIDPGAFYDCSSMTDISIPSTVEVIDVSAFDGCVNLKTIKFNKGIKKIDASAFAGCKSLKSVTIPEGVTNIESGAFWGCSSIESVILPNSLKNIGDYCFSNCEKLKLILIPSNVTNIEAHALGLVSINDESYKKVNGFTIIGKKGTVAESYAKNNGYSFISSSKFAPQLKSVSNLNTGVSVNWIESSLAKGYYIYRKTGSGSWSKIATISSGSTVTYTDKTAVAGTTYVYTVKAYNGSYTSSYDTTGKTLKRISQPTLSSITNGSSGLTIKWNKTSGASGYYVYRKTGSGSWTKIATIKSASTVSYLDKTAKAGTTYTYTVRAYSGSYISSYNTSGKSLKRLTQPVPTVANASSGVTVKWGKVTGATGYYVYRKTGSGSWAKIATIKSGSTISYLDKTAKAGTTYSYTVRAYNGSYISSYLSAGKSIRRLTQPTVSVPKVSTGINVKWTKATGATGYYVYRKTAGKSWSRIATIKSGKTVSYVDKTAKKGTTYYYTVRAYYGSYTSSYNTSGKAIKR